jgi:hypothetical protein
MEGVGGPGGFQDAAIRSALEEAQVVVVRISNHLAHGSAHDEVQVAVLVPI